MSSIKVLMEAGGFLEKYCVRIPVSRKIRGTFYPSRYSRSRSSLDKLLQNIKKKLPIGCEVVQDETEPIAFGLSALKLQEKIPVGMVGGTSPVEDAISAIPNVQRVETEMVSHYWWSDE